MHSVSTDQLSDLGVIVLDHSVKQQSSQIHIHPWNFAAGTEMIRITVEQKKRPKNIHVQQHARELQSMTYKVVT